jgi:hypothetical protein
LQKALDKVEAKRKREEEKVRIKAEAKAERERLKDEKKTGMPVVLGEPMAYTPDFPPSGPMKLSPEAAEVLIKAVENPPESTEALKSLFKEEIFVPFKLPMEEK